MRIFLILQNIQSREEIIKIFRNHKKKQAQLEMTYTSFPLCSKYVIATQMIIWDDRTWL